MRFAFLAIVLTLAACTGPANPSDNAGTTYLRAAPSPKWTAKFGEAADPPLLNLPVVDTLENSPQGIVIRITNVGTTTLTYLGRGAQSPQYFGEIWKDFEWTP